MTAFRLIASLATAAMLLVACDVGAELTTTTEAPTTTVVLGEAARARETACRPFERFIEINPIVGFPAKVEETVVEARGLLAEMEAAEPGGITKEYAAWIGVRQGALDAIEEAAFDTGALDATDPRFVDIASEPTRQMESLLLTYCTAETVLDSHPWLEVIDPILVPPQPALEERLENGLVLRSLAEIGDVAGTYIDAFGDAVPTEEGLRWAGTYASEPYSVLVRYDGFGSFVRITRGEPQS